MSLFQDCYGERMITLLQIKKHGRSRVFFISLYIVHYFAD